MAIVRKGNSYNYSDVRQKILSQREQADLKNKWLEYRLDHILPMVMKRAGIDMWLVISREYNEDPVVMSLLPAPAINAWGRPILVFTLQEDGTVEKLYVQRRAGTASNKFYTIVPSPDKDQWKGLYEVVKERNPKKIGVNFNIASAHCDGIGHGDFLSLEKALGEEYMKRVVSAEEVCIGWLETRTEEEMAAYEGICHIAHSIIDEAFSRKVVNPGITTALDVQWWIKQKMADLGVPAWFPPNVQIIRPGYGFAGSLPEESVIMPGDILWTDYGIIYLELYSDQQEIAYVLKHGEKDAPEGIKQALKTGNRLQDILKNEIKVGRTGNEILQKTVEEAERQGVRGAIYSHPIGYHGHAAGPVFGTYDTNLPVPISGDHILHDNTCYSMELYAYANVPEWDNQEIRVQLEQDIVVKDGVVSFLDGRQEELHLI